VIDFVQAAHKNKENVLIHCIQGISRSVTFVIAYIIFKYGYDYKKAESFVKQKRSIACPNNGFMV
jgi:dual specificity phosphatase 12